MTPKFTPVKGLVFVSLLSLTFFSCSFKKEVLSKEESSPYNNIIKRAQYELDIVKDPVTGKIPAGIKQAEIQQALSLPSREDIIMSRSNIPLANNLYTAVGPDNLGGRTRALAYDSRYDGIANRVMLAGSVSSGVFRTADGGANWIRVNGTANIHNITSIAQDNSAGGNKDHWYLCTGEALGNSTSDAGSFYLGHGVYKSTDNGVTWARLATSNAGTVENFDAFEDLMSKIVVNPANGHVYVAKIGGIMRSTDGGLTWNTVLNMVNGSTAEICDVVINNAGVVFASFSGTAAAPAGASGIWRSPTGNLGTFVRIAGQGVVGGPVGWPLDASYGRIVMAIAPSDNNTFYALLENPASLPTLHSFYTYNIATTVWSGDRGPNLPDEPGGNLAGNDPFDSQGGYDLVISVKPNLANFVVIGGTTLYRSTDAFATNANYLRIGGYNSNANYALYPNHHPDVHSFAWQPNNNNILASGDDGGIQTADVTLPAVAWGSLNNSYQTYQYYYVAIDPSAGSTKYIGGAQDNGTTYRSAGTNSWTLVFGGDGVSVGIAAGNAFHYCGTQNGDIRRRLPAAAQNVGTNIKPAAVVTDGLFITLFHLFEENTEDLVYANDNKLYRTSTASTVTTGAGWTEMTGISNAVGAANQIRSIATTRGPYAATHCLYLGTGNAKIYRIADPRNVAAATAPVDITPVGITAGSTVIGIAIAPGDADIAMAVISNYGANSVYWTNNARAAVPVWRMVEGTGINKLSLPSFRSVEIVSRSVAAVTVHEYYVGTSAGLFSTTLIDGTSQVTADLTSWAREGTGVIDQAVVSSLVVRPGDNTLLVGTHGNGAFTAVIASPLPVTVSSFNAKRFTGYVRLDWNVSSEMNVKEYQVERKYKHEADFSLAAKTSSPGNTNASRDYSLKDQNVSFNYGTIQYRLKMVDLDGKINYGKIVSVNVPAKDFIVNIYPTVTTDNITVEVGAMAGLKKMNISIVNSDGKYLSSKDYVYQKTTIPVSHLPAGVYYLVISNGTEDKFSRRFVKR